MYREDTVVAAATAIAAHSAVLGLAHGSPEDAFGALVGSLDLMTAGEGLDLDSIAFGAHVARGRSRYLVTVICAPSAHHGDRSPPVFDLEVTAASLRKACELALQGARTNRDIHPVSQPIRCDDGLQVPDPDRYAAMVTLRQGEHGDVAVALRADREVKRARAAPSPLPVSLVPEEGDEVAAARRALVVHGALLGMSERESTSLAGIERLSSSLFDYAEVRATDLFLAIDEAREQRFPMSSAA